MSILFSSKAKEHIKKAKYSHFLIDVNFIVEPCTQISNPYIIPITNKNIVKYKDFEKVRNNKFTFFISNRFIEIYGKLEEYQLEVGGFFKKILVINNVDPIIRNTCKIN